MELNNIIFPFLLLLLKLYIFKIKEFSYDYILILDADILLLKNLVLFEANKPILFQNLTGDKKMHIPYQKTNGYILPRLKSDGKESGICHLMLFHKQTINQLLQDIEHLHNKPAWKVCLDAVNNYIKYFGLNSSILSEYELYYRYIQTRNIYKIVRNVNFVDMCYNKFDFVNDKDKYAWIADHDYQSAPAPERRLVDNYINDIYILIKKYKKGVIMRYEATRITSDGLLKNLYNKIVPTDEEYTGLEILQKNGFSKEDIINIVRHENLLKVKNIRQNIDNIIGKFLRTLTMPQNNYFKSILTHNIDLKTDKFFFGIVIPVYNRYYITKIFLECLKYNLNFDSVIFCIVDDGSDDNLIRELSNLNLKYILVCCNRKNNIYGSTNTTVPGSLYPLTLYIGHELIKRNCNYLGVLDSDSFINENYFNDSKLFMEQLDMNNTIFSGFNSYSAAHKVINTSTLCGKNILYKNMVGGISQFYSIGLYENFKFKFTGEESSNYWAYDYDYQISEFMKRTGRKYICLEKSNIQHIGIKTTMIRGNIEHNNNDASIINTVYNVLKDPQYKDKLDIEFDFDKNFIGSNNIEKIFNNLMDSSKYNINTFLDKIIYINLDERTDRREIMETQFKKFGITDYERFSAVKPKFNSKYNNEFIDNQIEQFLNNKGMVDDLILDISTKYIADFSKEYIKSKSLKNRRKYILGALGCKMSHLNAFRFAKEKDYDNILLIEDDALFHSNFIEHFNKLIINLKENDYDIVWLCPNWLYKDNNGILNRCYSYKYINDDFAQVNGSKSIDCKYGSTLNNGGNIFSKKCINFILENFENTKQSEIDMWYRQNIQINNKVFTTIPNLIRQRVEESNIEEYQVNYDKDIHYRTRQKFNIFTIVEEENKERYFDNLKNNLQKMIGYEKIYYISDKELFNNEILHYINRQELEDNIEKLKEKFHEKVSDNNIKYFYYMDVNTFLKDDFFPFNENNNLVDKKNFY